MREKRKNPMDVCAEYVKMAVDQDGMEARVVNQFKGMFHSYSFSFYCQ